MIKVMLIDDEQEIRRLLHRMVEKQPDYQVVAECGGFAEAVTDFARFLGLSMSQPRWRAT